MNSQDVINVGVCPKDIILLYSPRYASQPAIKFISIFQGKRSKSTEKREKKVQASQQQTTIGGRDLIKH